MLKIGVILFISLVILFTYALCKAASNADAMYGIDQESSKYRSNENN